MIQPTAFNISSARLLISAGFFLPISSALATFSEGGKIRQQVVKLINKAQLLVAQFSFRCRRQFAHWLTIKNHIAGGWRIQPAQQVQQGTLPEPELPTIAIISPSPTLKLTLCSTSVLYTAFLIAFAQVVALQQDLIHNVKPQRVEWRQRAMKGKA